MPRLPGAEFKVSHYPRRDSALITQIAHFSLKMKHGRAVALVAALYVASYFAMMDRYSPAMDCGKGTCYVMFDSSFQFAKYSGDIPKPTFWNYLFLPLDGLYFTASPSQRKYGDRKRFDLTELAEEYALAKNDSLR